MKRYGLVKIVTVVGFLLSLLAFSDIASAGTGTGRILGMFSGSVVAILGAAGLVAVGFFALFLLALLPWTDPFFAWLRRALTITRPLGVFNWLLALAPGLAFAWVVIGKYALLFTPLYARLWLFWIAVLLGAALALAALGPGRSMLALCLAAGAFGAIAQAAFFLPGISNSPMSLGWSEGDRYYEASLYLSQSLYGLKLPLPVLHSTRYLMQAVPFLIPNLPIIAHRIWQILLWLLFTALGGAALVSRLHLKGRAARWAVGLWAFNFLFQGPVYYHLMVCALVPLWTFDRRRPLRSSIFILLTSIWAGLSRINWYFVPGLLAAMLYLLEEPKSARSWWRYLVPPAAWTLGGTAVAYLVGKLYVPLSGNPADVFDSAFKSPLLWYRLFPNTTYGDGILIGSLIAVLPAAMLVLAKLLWRPQRWFWMRALGIVAILGAFFTGGIIVSTKVGGGSNLHNLDAFFVFLAVAAAYLFFDQFAPDETEETPAFATPAWLTLTVLLLPLIIAIVQMPASLPVEQPAPTQELAQIQQAIDAAQPKGQILFITEHQLLAFHQLTAASFDPDYEKVFLMEMAMSSNKPYLERFYKKLNDHAYSLIIAEPLNTLTQDQTRAFSEENNLWVKNVSAPVLSQYRVLAEYKDLNITLLVPKP